MSLLAALGMPNASLVPIAGGDINQAFRVEHGDKRLFVKTHHAPPAGMFAAEARALEALAEAAEPGPICVPSVISVGPRHLALEWIGDRPIDPQANLAHRSTGRVAVDLGVGLAAIHRRTAPSFGWSEANWIGTLPQPNPSLTGAAEFFAEARIQAQLALGPQLPRGARGRLDQLCARLPDLLPDEPPALLHGDLWGGNWTTDASGRPWLYDPASYFGHREADLAMTRLFGGFPSDFYAAYNEALPLQPGFDERVDLWNLYPLLVHANLFGGGYGSQADAIARRYV